MTTSQSLPRTLLVMVAVAGLLAALILVSAPSPNGPELAAGGNHAQVSGADSANGPVAQGNGVFMGGALKHDTSRELRATPGDPVRALVEDEEEGDEAGGDE